MNKSACSSKEWVLIIGDRIADQELLRLWQSSGDARLSLVISEFKWLSLRISQLQYFTPQSLCEKWIHWEMTLKSTNVPSFREAYSATKIPWFDQLIFRFWQFIFLLLLQKAQETFLYPATVLPSCLSYEQEMLETTVRCLSSTSSKKEMPFKDHLELVCLC